VKRATCSIFLLLQLQGAELQQLQAEAELAAQQYDNLLQDFNGLQQEQQKASQLVKKVQTEKASMQQKLESSAVDKKTLQVSAAACLRWRHAVLVAAAKQGASAPGGSRDSHNNANTICTASAASSGVMLDVHDYVLHKQCWVYLRHVQLWCVCVLSICSMHCASVLGGSKVAESMQ
jgi:hypothetical protein